MRLAPLLNNEKSHFAARSTPGCVFRLLCVRALHVIMSQACLQTHTHYNVGGGCVYPAWQAAIWRRAPFVFSPRSLQAIYPGPDNSTRAALVLHTSAGAAALLIYARVTFLLRPVCAQV